MYYEILNDILTIHMNVVEGEVLGFPVSADEIDGPIGVSDGLEERLLIPHVDRDVQDLAQVSGHL